tara:strand:+ start:112 stop:426 length:315 start_codon:yes stop_codon:yes gene_type:complete
MITKKEILDIIEKEHKISLLQDCMLLERDYQKVADNIIEKIKLKRKAKECMEALNFEVWKKRNFTKIYSLYFSKCSDDVLTKKQVKTLYDKYKWFYNYNGTVLI